MDCSTPAPSPTPGGCSNSYQSRWWWNWRAAVHGVTKSRTCLSNWTELWSYIYYIINSFTLHTLRIYSAANTDRDIKIRQDSQLQNLQKTYLKGKDSACILWNPTSKYFTTDNKLLKEFTITQVYVLSFEMSIKSNRKELKLSMEMVQITS